MDSNTIPDGKNIWGRFYELRDAVDNALKGLCAMRLVLFQEKYLNLTVCSYCNI